MTVDYVTVEWSPTRQLAVVRMTCDEIPVDECDEAAHQLLACGNLARRMNTEPALRVEAPSGVTVKMVASTGPVADARPRCGSCGRRETDERHVTLRPNPYKEDVNGDPTPEWLCDECASEAAGDI